MPLLQERSGAFSGMSTWRESGTTEMSGIPVGQHTIEFYSVSGWTKPDNLTVTINEDQTTSASGTYSPPSGSLQVIISPPEAIAAGCEEWRVDGGAWHDSGEVVTGIPVGMHSVSFISVTGWTRPANRTVTIVNNKTTTITVYYSRLSHPRVYTLSKPRHLCGGGERLTAGMPESKDYGRDTITK